MCARSFLLSRLFNSRDKERELQWQDDPKRCLRDMSEGNLNHLRALRARVLYSGKCQYESISFSREFLRGARGDLSCPSPVNVYPAADRSYTVHKVRLDANLAKE